MEYKEALEEAKKRAGLKNYIHIPELNMKFGIEEYADMISQASITMKEDKKNTAIKKAEKAVKDAEMKIPDDPGFVSRAFGLDEGQAEAVIQEAKESNAEALKKASNMVKEANQNA